MIRDFPCPLRAKGRHLNAFQYPITPFGHHTGALASTCSEIPAELSTIIGLVSMSCLPDLEISPQGEAGFHVLFPVVIVGVRLFFNGDIHTPARAGEKLGSYEVLPTGQVGWVANQSPGRQRGFVPVPWKGVPWVSEDDPDFPESIGFEQAVDEIQAKRVPGVLLPPLRGMVQLHQVQLQPGKQAQQCTDAELIGLACHKGGLGGRQLEAEQCAFHAKVPELANLQGRQALEEAQHVLGAMAVDRGMSEDERAGFCVNLAVGQQDGQAGIVTTIFAAILWLARVEHQGPEQFRVYKLSDLRGEVEK